MIVLDADVLIAVLTPADEQHYAGLELLARAIANGEDLLVNPVTLAEALVFPAREGRARVAEQAAALAELGVTEVPFPPGAAGDLAMLRITELRMPDRCVLLTALDRQAVLASFDDQLRRAAHAHGSGWRSGNRSTVSGAVRRTGGGAGVCRARAAGSAHGGERVGQETAALQEKGCVFR